VSRPTAKLGLAQNIGRFVQEVNTFDQVSKVTASGWDPKQAKEMTGPGKGGDEYGKQGGTVTGAQLVKQMFGEVEQVLPVATGQKNPASRPWRRASSTSRAAVFRACRGARHRRSGDPRRRRRPGGESRKAGRRASTTVVSNRPSLFVDTGYATELAPRRYTIKKAHRR